MHKIWVAVKDEDIQTIWECRIKECKYFGIKAAIKHSPIQVEIPRCGCCNNILTYAYTEALMPVE